ncbi:MAG: tripartite tricarboxylate transporter TctB family protein [Sphingomonadaceae bacterium]
MKRSDAVLGGAAVLLGAAVYLNTLAFPTMPDGAPGPALFPQILSALLILFGGIIVAQSIRPHVQEERHYEPKAILKAGGVLVAIALYVMVVQKVGFLITAAAILFGLMMMLGVRVRVGLPASVAIALFCVLLFEKVLRVPLPPGVLGG